MTGANSGGVRALSDLDLTRLVADAPGRGGREEAARELERREREVGPLNYATGKRTPILVPEMRRKMKARVWKIRDEELYELVDIESEGNTLTIGTREHCIDEAQARGIALTADDIEEEDDGGTPRKDQRQQ